MFKEIDDLRRQLDEAIERGVEEGSLDEASQLKQQIEERVVEIKDNLIPFESYKIEVDYNQTIRDLVEAGHYDLDFLVFDRDKLAKPEDTGKNSQEMRVFLFKIRLGSVASSEEIIEQMGKLGLRPVNARELLTIGSQCPNLQLENTMAALGQVWIDRTGDERVACLGGESYDVDDEEGKEGLQRMLFSDGYGGGWFSDWVFPAVRR